MSLCQLVFVGWERAVYFNSDATVLLESCAALADFQHTPPKVMEHPIVKLANAVRSMNGECHLIWIDLLEYLLKVLLVLCS